MKTSVEFWESVAAAFAVRRRRWHNVDTLLAPLRGLDVGSHSDIVKRLPMLSQEQRIAAIQLLGILGVRIAGPALVRCWLSDDSNERYAAKVALESIHSRRAHRQILQVVRTHADAGRQEEACYILAWSRDVTMLEPLRAIFADAALPPRVRGQAAEGLGLFYWHRDGRTREFRRSLAVLLQGLHDASPEVRFWACYALGQMCSRAALPALRQVAAEDTALCPGWWLVKDEAADAICQILNKQVPDRDRIIAPE